VSVISDKEMVIQKLDAIPIEIVVHNFVDKDLADRFGLEECSSLNSPIHEFYLKNNQSPMVNQTHLQALGIIEAEEFRKIERFTSKINAVLRSFFQRRQLQLIRFRLEYGKLNGKIVFASDLTPDTVNLADISGGELNFDRFRLTANTASDIYHELKERILQQ
jgi:phosphoribosylaminoimidazole-succinocarboxamide synthase